LRVTLFTLLSWICFPEWLSGSSVTVASNPAGLTILVDGIAATAPQTFTWATGSSHSLSVASPQQGGTGTRYVFSGWSDSGGQTNTVTAFASDTTYTVMFKTQYLLTVTASPPGAGTFAFYPPSIGVGANLVGIVPQAATGYISHGF
jgi:hypothetical protein